LNCGYPNNGISEVPEEAHEKRDAPGGRERLGCKKIEAAE